MGLLIWVWMRVWQIAFRRDLKREFEEAQGRMEVPISANVIELRRYRVNGRR